MSYPVHKPQPMTDETVRLTRLVSERAGRYKAIHFGFNGVRDVEGVMMGGRAVFDPPYHTNDQRVRLDLERFASGTRARPLWTIVLRYDARTWVRLLELAQKTEVIFDMMLYDPERIKYERIALFRCLLNSRVKEYKFLSVLPFGFESGGMRVRVQSDGSTVVVVKLLESGYHELAMSGAMRES
jgi:hypothetical protein